MLRIGRAILRQRPRERRLLLVVACTAASRVELDEHLAGPHPVAQVREDRADLPVGFRRDRDLIDGGEGADDVHRSFDRVAADLFDAHRSGGELLGTGRAVSGLEQACGDGEEDGKPASRRMEGVVGIGSRDGGRSYGRLSLLVTRSR